MVNFILRQSLRADQRESIFSLQSHPAALIAHLTKFLRQAPLQIVAHAALEYGLPESLSRGLFDAYDKFLALLNDEEKRAHLDKLAEEDLEHGWNLFRCKASQTRIQGCGPTAVLGRRHQTVPSNSGVWSVLMGPIGFSTGALAYSDFRKGLDILSKSSARAVELSALRNGELIPLLDSIDSLNLSQFSYVSFHAPGQFETAQEPGIISN